jgi:hypothetical protein
VRRLATSVAILAIIAASCAGPNVLGGAEGVLPPEPPAPQIVLDVSAGDDATPLVARIEIDGVAVGRTDVAGAITIEWSAAWDAAPPTITVDSPGFHAATIEVEGYRPEALPVRLDPVVLDGTIIAADGRPLPGATVTLDEREAVTDENGEFRIVRAVGGEVLVRRPAWADVLTTWDGSATGIEISMEPRMIRALRVSGDKAGDPSAWGELLDLADTTGINAFVVDTKDELGTVMRDVDLAAPYGIGAVKVFYDTESVIDDMDAHGLYKITRIVTFQDDPWATANPHLGVRNSATGGVWENDRGLAWLDATDRDSWEYALDLAVESCERGFDEIQFDYVRFPSDGPVAQAAFDELEFGSSEQYYGAEAQELRTATVAAFLAEARARLNPLGCAVAADIFAIVLESSSDEGIGQSPVLLANTVDVMSPMIYTYTYGPGWKGFEDPDDHAVEIVGEALDAGIRKLADGGFSIYRPWIQRAFLQDTEIRELQAVPESRNLGWMLWSNNTEFNAAMLPPPE